jgi:hypothetical protein
LKSSNSSWSSRNKGEVAMALKDRMRRLRREAEKGAVVVRLRDGKVRAFDAMTVWKEMFLTQMDLFKGESKCSEVLDAVRNATPESRAEFEERFGPINMTATIIAGAYEGAWAEVFNLREDGMVERVYHEGGCEEAERIRQEAQQR